MKKLTFWKSLFLLCALIVGSTSAWAQESTWTWTAASSSDLGSTSTTAGSSANVTLNGKSWTSERKLISGASYTGFTSSCIQLGKNGGVDNVTLTTSAFSGNVIKSVAVECSSYQGNHKVAIKVGSSTYLSATATSSWTTVSTKTGTGTSQGDIEIKFTNGSRALYIKSITEKYEPASTDPAINASNVDITADDTSGEIPFTISNPVADTHLTATITAGNAWLSNATVDETNGKVTFTSTVNEDMDNSREGTIHLVYGDNVATKDITITQAAMPAKYSVTYTAAQTNGTLTIKKGDDVVASGASFPVGTKLTIVATPDENYAVRNWQYKRDGGSWVTNTAATTYTMTDKNVEFRANFDPTYAVNFSINGQVVSTSRYAEGKKITFPESVTPFENFTFVGWAEAAIDGSVTDAPTLVDTSNETMGNADKTYYAVYGENNKSIATATFDASDITNLTAATTTKTWTDNATGIQMYISNGDRYTGTPNAWNVTKSTSNNDYYMSIGRAKCAIKKVVITVTGSDYAFGDYYAYTYTSDETGTDLTSDVTSSNNVYTWQLQNDYEQVILWSGYSYQVRATKIVVDAEMDVVKGYMTTIPTTGTITLNAACTDGNVIYGTYYTNRAYEMPENVVGQVVSVDNDGKLVVEDAYNPGDVVPAYTALLLYTIDDFTGTKDYTITYSTGGTDLSDYNMLKGTLTADDETTGDNCLFYRLTMHKGTTIGFYWGAENGAAFKPGANKAYLAVPAAQAAKMSGFAFDSTTTGINGVEEIAPVTKTRKVVKNGRLVIETANGEFTIDGARMK